MVARLFAPSDAPPLPGLLCFASFTSEEDAVFIPLDGLSDAAEIRERLRTLFAVANATTRHMLDRGKGLDDFSSSLGRELLGRRIDYTRAGRRSMREWLIEASQIAWDHRADIVTAASLAGA